MTDSDKIAGTALALQRAGRAAEARRVVEDALKTRPDDADLRHALGVLWHLSGNLAAAVVEIERAIALRPSVAAWHVNLGVVLRALGRIEDAAASHRRAIAVDPNAVDAHDYLGNALRDLGQLAEGTESHRRAHALDPNRPSVLNNLANALFAEGRHDEAARLFRRAIELKSDFAEAHSNLIFALDFDPNLGTAEQQAERRRWWEAHGRRFAAKIPAHGNERDPERRLRVGYVSADFLGHSAASLFAPIVMGHDPVAYEVVCYANAPREDDMTARFKARAKLWRPVFGMDDDRMAELIRADGIDILVDLSGHSAGNRLPVFARKPAPVQITAWGHGTGTGLPVVDAFLADPVIVPEDERKHFAERVVDLPASLTFAPAAYAPPAGPPPVETEGIFTFGSLNRMTKTPDEALRLWARIAGEAGGARLLLKDRAFDDETQRRRVLGALAEAGLPSERVLLLGGSSHRDHLAAYSRIDLGLDPFPHGGGVSTLEALWMGVPVVTLVGRTIAGRFSAAMETAIGLGAFAAPTLDDYARIAVAASRDRPALARLRAELRGRVAASAVGDARRYVRAVEEVYRDLWRRWCAGLA